MVLFVGRFVVIFAEIRVFPSLCVCGPANSSDGGSRCFQGAVEQNGGIRGHMLYVCSVGGVAL